ncbi:hypothetical protein OG884_23215 [Streptosporangium sp. NBC_01755]|uniref:hypothetical protein n=1 Tax=unclassified Streptosporangium TaxID=2632669 RepID=UPI002DDB25D0|nr:MULTISPECIES: hypothetical protein [unclassified Streptosporangium]WSA24131.1 hypothetical protein OIE13_24705 [Streptosporangium sp. NBC_01810]WSC97795.1 hypothetical protein OG884_23215 [Streptosporangium sp. NBC_01755]
MIWFLLALVAVAILAPLVGADTRDSLDWHHREPSPDEGMLDTTAGHARVPAARERVAAHRPTPAAG